MFSIPPGEKEKIIRHYKLEKRLADRLRQASRQERLRLYQELYDELFVKLPYLKTDPRTVDRSLLATSWRLLRPYLKKDSCYLEIGAGNLALARHIAPFVKKVYALDVSREFATALGPIPKKIELIISDGISVPLKASSIDLAYSCQLMEHLHPDDAKEQLKNIARSLKPGGRYICDTPHAFTGPHDVSKYFDDTPTGFHLKEYTNAELTYLFHSAGFSQVYALIGAKGYVMPCPVFLLAGLEALLRILPISIRQKASWFLPIKILLGIKLVGVK